MIPVSTASAPSGTAPGHDEVLAALDVPSTLEQFSLWISTQRWYSGKGKTPRPRITGGYDLVDTSGGAALRVVFVLDEADTATPKLYQIPLSARCIPLPTLAPSLVATGLGEHGRALYLYDGPHDPAFARALLQLILSEGAAAADVAATAGIRGGGGPSMLVRGHTAFPHSSIDIVTSRVLGGEQSNTSIVYEMKDASGTPAAPVICKLFRTLQHGDNPDVVLLDALGAVGSPVVPRSIGHLTGQWSDTRRPGGIAHGHLAFAQEFLPGVEDAWRIALRAAEEGRDFTIAARALGEATAEVHKTLAHVLGTTPCADADIRDTMASMRRRLRLAIEEVPALAEHRTAIETAYARAAAVHWPELQRIHGDLHLGQVLAVPGRGWVLLDFEGEPLRPMSERSRPDIPLRDVAGMLRSFDYVAGACAGGCPDLSATDWALACRRAFVGGYSACTGHNLREDRALLDAFEIDKAIYEAIYEAHNRPEWLPIPVAAITRLAQRAGAG